MTNKVIQNYVLKDKLGSGQYGNVFMAQDQKTKDIVAIKIMNIQKFKTTPKLSEFTSNQINILTKIDSPHIIKFVEMLRTVNNYYLIYEYCNGGTLTQILEKRRFLKEAEALKIFAQMVEAFKVLVKENILHRDLKPSNILFHDGVLKLADFGFCKELLKENDMTQTMVGSPIYMAPEVLKGQTYNCKADIWSMGVVLYEMLFGVCPYEQKSIAKLVSLMDQTSLNFPLNVNPISESTQNLIKRMLTVDVKKRMNPNDLINYKLNLPSEKKDSQEEIFRFHRQNLEYMLETLLTLANEVDISKDKLILAYLLYKTIYCYENDLKKKERYWHLVKVTNFPDAWERVIEDESSKIQPIGNALKQAIILTNPITKLKIELDTFYVNIGLFFDYIQILKNSDPLKNQLVNCMLMYRHMFNVLEKDEITFDKVVGPNEDATYQQILPKKLDKCKEYVKDMHKV